MQSSEPAQDSFGRRLNGWKEIGAYLGKSARTVQRWERDLGLPIRRINTAKGEIVFAFAPEIDSWQVTARLIGEPEGRDSERNRAEHIDDASQPPLVTPLNAPQANDISVVESSLRSSVSPGDSKSMLVPLRGPTAVGRTFSRSLFVVLATAFVVAVAVLSLSLLAASKQPASFRAEQNVLVILDDKGTELWRKVFPTAFRTEYENDPNRLLWIGDLDGDGRSEVLFHYFSTHDENSLLYCFSASGRELWKFVPGHVVRTAAEVFEPPFFIRDFKVVPSIGGNVIAVTSTHHRFYPTQVAILSPQGRVESEYWHSGHLAQIGVADLNHDGKQELYLTGINNEYRIATLVVLSIDEVSGVSRQTDPRYQIMDMPIASELGRVYFPRTCVNRAMEPYNVATRVQFNNHGLSVSVMEELHNVPPQGMDYDLSPDLEVLAVSPPDGFLGYHKQLEARGILHHSFSEAELRELANINNPK